jgi:hypothetical protein
MGIIREPKGVDFEVNPRPLKDWEKKQISDAINYFKKTGKVLKNITVNKKKKQNA